MPKPEKTVFYCVTDIYSSTHEKTGRGGHHRLPRPVLFFCLFLADFCYADPADV